MRIQTQATVQTLRHNPFDYLLFDWATHLPIDYPRSLAAQLQPYLTSPADPCLQTLAWELWDQVHGESTAFLQALNQRIYTECRYILREKGDPWPAMLTWQRKPGFYRELTLLFTEAWQTVGLAARFVRFVSGYAATQHWHDPVGGPELSELCQKKQRKWSWIPFITLSRPGWKSICWERDSGGLTPQGLAVANQPVALAASAHPRSATSIRGYCLGGIQSNLHYRIRLEVSSGIQG